MKKNALLLLITLLTVNFAFAQKVSTKVIDNKGTIKWVLDSSTQVITKADSTILYVTPKQLKDSLGQQLSGYINAADNGLTKNGQTVELGGTLNKPTTTIVTSATNFLQITGLQKGASATDSVVVIDPVSGQLKIISAANLLTQLTAGNGLNKNGNNIELGGQLNKNTSIDVNGNTLSIQGLQSGSAVNDSLVVIDPTTGALKRAAATTLLQSDEKSFTATANQTTFSMPGMPATASKVWVYRNGAKLVANVDFNSTTANQVTLTPAGGWSVEAGDLIEIQWVK